MKTDVLEAKKISYGIAGDGAMAFRSGRDGTINKIPDSAAVLICTTALPCPVPAFYALVSALLQY
jgi:hypothetical protein